MFAQLMQIFELQHFKSVYEILNFTNQKVYLATFVTCI